MAKSSKKEFKKGKLTPKVERFCQYYIVSLNATDAARKAGYSEKTATAIGWENLRKPNIANRINELRKDEAGKLNMQKEDILSVLREVIQAKMEDIIDPETGTVLPPEKWPDHMKRVVNGLEADEFYGGPEGAKFPIGMKRKVKLADRLKAIELLNRMLGFNLPDKVAAVTPDGEAAAPVINIYTVQPKKDE